MKGFLQTKGGGQEGKMHYFFLLFFERGGGAAGGSGRAVGFVDIITGAALGPYGIWPLGPYAFQP